MCTYYQMHYLLVCVWLLLVVGLTWLSKSAKICNDFVVEC